MGSILLSMALWCLPCVLLVRMAPPAHSRPVLGQGRGILAPTALESPAFLGFSGHGTYLDKKLSASVRKKWVDRPQGRSPVLFGGRQALGVPCQHLRLFQQKVLEHAPCLIAAVLLSAPLFQDTCSFAPLPCPAWLPPSRPSGRRFNAAFPTTFPPKAAPHC